MMAYYNKYDIIQQMKRIVVFLCLFLFFSIKTTADTLKEIRHHTYEEKLRIVFDLDSNIDYKIKKEEKSLEVILPDCKAKEGLKDIIEIDDWVVRYLEVKKINNDLKVKIPLKYPVDYKVFFLKTPPRLVFDFTRKFLSILEEQNLADGAQYKKILKYNNEKIVTVHLLEVNPDKSIVMPVLATKGGNIIDKIIDFFNPKKYTKHFTLQRVSNIVDDYNALAGINGTFYSYSGTPLGMLMINKVIVSCPIYDRTALIITDKKRYFIDNIWLRNYLMVEGKRFSINGINQLLSSSKNIILYNYFWGKTTGTKGKGIELTVRNGKITDIQLGNSKIPEDGYVLSFGPHFAEVLPSLVKKEMEVNIKFELVPYSAKLSKDENILHVIGGGPRLLKRGMVYISKFEEKFKSDVALGRAARTALGIKEDGTLLFLTVDGRPRKKIREKDKEYSQGMSLTELAYFLKKHLKAEEALNFDGGSSSTMAIEGRPVNFLLTGHEKRVSNALLVYPKEIF
jgi:exopolysaccharide biosynthesis protein